MNRPPRRFVRYARSRNGARDKEENFNENQYTEEKQTAQSSDQNSDENQHCLSIRTMSSESELQEHTEALEKPVSRWTQESESAGQVQQNQCLWRTQNQQQKQQNRYHSGNNQQHQRNRGNRRSNNNNGNKYRNNNNNNGRNNNSNFTRVNREILSSPEETTRIEPQLLPTHKIAGVLSDTAICVPSATPNPTFNDSNNLTHTIESLTETLEQIVNKLKNNELIMAIGEVDEALKQTTRFCEQTAGRGYAKKGQCLKQLIGSSLAAAGKGWKHVDSEDPEQYTQQISLIEEGGSDYGCSIHEAPLRPKTSQDSEQHKSRLTGVRMISRSTTMHNDILQISNVCFGYRLTLPVQMIHCLVMLFICLSFCLKKNSQIVVYILTIGLVAVAVHVLSRNVYYYVNANPAGVNITNDATF